MLASCLSIGRKPCVRGRRRHLEALGVLEPAELARDVAPEFVEQQAQAHQAGAPVLHQRQQVTVAGGLE
jgi:hypothetical protein